MGTIRRVKSAPPLLEWPRATLDEIIETIETIDEEETSMISYQKMPSVKNISEDTLVELVRKRNNVKLKKIVKEGIPKEGFSNKYRITAIVEAVKVNNKEALLILMRGGRSALTPAKKSSGSALDLAVKKEKEEFITLILENTFEPVTMEEDSWYRIFTNSRLREVFMHEESGVAGMTRYLIMKGEFNRLYIELCGHSIRPVMLKEYVEINEILTDEKLLDLFIIGEQGPRLVAETIRRNYMNSFKFLLKKLSLLNERTSLMKKAIKASLLSPDSSFFIALLCKEGITREEVKKAFIFCAQHAQKMNFANKAQFLLKFESTY